MTQRPFSHELSDDGGTLTLHGELDELATARLRQLFTTLTDELARGLRVDLSDVDFLPSAALGVLAAARNAADRTGGSLTFVATSGTIAQRVLTICALPYEEA
jgi:anti-anti-sigma factor